MANDKRLFDANAFKMFLEYVRQDYLEEDTFSSDFAAKVIETVQDEYLANAPTVDAVEVVRCKDCKSCAIHHNHITLRYQLFCTHGKGYPEVSADDFCSYGERKDDHE